MTICALMLGREGSTGFPGKNTYPVLGRPLMAYPLLAAKHAPSVAEVYVSTDSPRIQAVAQEMGARTIDRPPELATKTALGEDAYVHGYGVIRDRLKARGESLELLVLLFCNAPTVTAAQIEEAVRALRDHPEYDSAVTVSRYNMWSPLRARRVGPDGLLHPFVPFETFGDPATLNCDRDSQGDVWFADMGLSVVRPRCLENLRDGLLPQKWMGRKIWPIRQEGGLDVDYDWQLPAAEEWLRRRGFTEDATPYDRAGAGARGAGGDWPRPAFRTPPEKRVLVTTAPFGDQDPKPLELLKAAGAEFVVNPLGRRLTEEELAKAAGDFGVIIAGTEPITHRVMAAAPHLRLISRVGVGLDSVDLKAAKERGIRVSYTPEAPAPAVAELAVGLMLDLLRHITEADRSLRRGTWQRFPGRRLSDCAVGILGAGRIGRRVAEHLAGGFPGVKLLANDIKPDESFGRKLGLRWVDKETLYKEADVISLHVPLTPQTRGLINARALSLMRPGALLVNTARGGIVDEAALADALRSRRLAGAAMDVFDKEPYAGELAGLGRCLLTCHMGSMAQDCRARMEIEATEEAVRFLRGEPLRTLVPEEEYALAGENARILKGEKS